MAGKVIALMVYPLGIFIWFSLQAIYLALAPQKVREDPFFVQYFGFFYLDYKPALVASGVFFLLQKLLLSFAVGLIPVTEPFFGVAIIFILAVSQFFILYYRPYRYVRWNDAAAVSNGVVLIVFLNSLIHSALDVFAQTWVVLVVQACCTIGILIYFAIRFYHEFHFPEAPEDFVMFNMKNVREEHAAEEEVEREKTRKRKEKEEAEEEKKKGLGHPKAHHEELPKLELLNVD